jgi:excisionase family DNA binding protein
MTDKVTPYATLEQAAKFFQVSLSTFRSWIQKGIVPRDSYIKLGSVYRFDMPAVETALKAQQTTQEGDDK